MALFGIATIIAFLVSSKIDLADRIIICFPVLYSLRVWSILFAWQFTYIKGFFFCVPFQLLENSGQSFMRSSCIQPRNTLIMETLSSFACHEKLYTYAPKQEFLIAIHLSSEFVWVSTLSFIIIFISCKALWTQRPLFHQIINKSLCNANKRVNQLGLFWAMQVWLYFLSWNGDIGPN